MVILRRAEHHVLSVEAECNVNLLLVEKKDIAKLKIWFEVLKLEKTILNIFICKEFKMFFYE